MTGEYTRAIEDLKLSALRAALPRLIEEGIVWMDKPYESHGSTEWKRKDIFECRLLDIEEVPNNYYMSPEKMDAKYGPRPEGQNYWLVEKIDESGEKKTEKRYSDHPDEKTQFQFKFEVVDGEHKGDWLWVFTKHYFTADGKGKRAALTKAIDPDIDLTIGIDNEKLKGRFVLLTVEPPEVGKSYPKVVDFMPTKLTEKEQKTLAVEADLEGEEIPF